MRYIVETQRMPGERFVAHPTTKRSLKEAARLANCTPCSQARIRAVHKGVVIEVISERDQRLSRYSRWPRWI